MLFVDTKVKVVRLEFIRVKYILMYTNVLMYCHIIIVTRFLFLMGMM